MKPVTKDKKRQGDIWYQRTTTPRKKDKKENNNKKNGTNRVRAVRAF